MSKIEFIEDQSEGYASRTKVNASADVTLAFAVDFTTAGEKLTKKSVKEQRKLYFPIDISKSYIHKKDIFTLVNSQCIKIAQNIEYHISKNIITLNIAGNGIYTLKGKFNQQDLDDFILLFLYFLKLRLEDLNIYIDSIRSGGQTGADESGLKASKLLKIKTICLAPKGWKFRNEFGQDICDEKRFKERF